MAASFVPHWQHSSSSHPLPCIATSFRASSPGALLSPVRLSDHAVAMSPQASHSKPSFGFDMPRIECLSVSRRSHRTRPKGSVPTFDDLPWISAMHCPPEVQTPWDIADLSQVAVAAAHHTSSRPKTGPVRRLRTTSRPSPVKHENEHPATRARRVSPTSQLSSKPPRTPRYSSNSSSHVHFRNLMPVFSFDSLHDSRPSDSNSPSLHLRSPIISSSSNPLLSSQSATRPVP